MNAGRPGLKKHFPFSSAASTKGFELKGALWCRDLGGTLVTPDAGRCVTS